MFKNFFILTVLLSLVGCGHTAKQADNLETASLSEQIQGLEADAQAAIAQQVDVLAPLSFAKAQKSIGNARDDLRDGEDQSEIQEQIDEGREHLKKANEQAALVQQSMQKAVTARKQVILANGVQYFPKEIKLLDEKFKNLAKDIEKGRQRMIADRASELQKAYLEVELRSIKRTHTSDVAATIEQAISEGARINASEVLSVAERKLKDAEDFIEGDRHNIDEVRSRADQARRAAAHLLKITRVAKANKDASPEEVALKLEEERNKTKEKQAEIATLETSKEFAERFNQAEKQFTDREAEVYKQGNKLVVRLKGLNFPPGKSELQDKNYGLLDKVKNVIEKFGKSSVKVEGYTDSEGGEKLNQKLSAERAEAVKEYLTANISPEAQLKIEAVGRGYERPIATNKTDKGRAENRRVDIVIEPERGY